MGAMKQILTLHGWATSIEKWGTFVEESAKLGIRLKIPFIPGLTKKVRQPWALIDYVDWLKKQVKTRKIILLGHSSGGRIALAFAVKYPQNVKKLILIDSAGIYHNELTLRIKRILFKNLALLGKKIIHSNKLRSLLYQFAGESDYKNANPLQRQIMINLISQDLTPFLKKIQVPTLIIWGEKDTITPLSDGKLMNKLISKSKLEIIKKAGHCPHFTHPKEVTEKIYAYL